MDLTSPPIIGQRGINYSSSSSFTNYVYKSFTKWLANRVTDLTIRSYTFLSLVQVMRDRAGQRCPVQCSASTVITRCHPSHQQNTWHFPPPPTRSSQSSHPLPSTTAGSHQTYRRRTRTRPGWTTAASRPPPPARVGCCPSRSRSRWRPPWLWRWPAPWWSCWAHSATGRSCSWGRVASPPCPELWEPDSPAPE